MEVLDENGELISWVSDDPDDFNSFSDYEWHIYELVLTYNEQAFEAGMPLLWFRKFLFSDVLTLDCVVLLSQLNIDAVPMFRDQLLEIKRWCEARLGSQHPDVPNREYLDHQDEEEMYAEYKMLKDKDPQKAFEILHELACRERAEFMIELAKAYEFGLGVEENMLRALYWTDQSLFGLGSAELRTELKDAGVTTPLYVAGINYDGPLKYESGEWWLAYYIKHGLISPNVKLE